MSALGFARRLAAQGVPLWIAERGGGEFRRPAGWQKITAAGNDDRLARWSQGMAICANTGAALTVFDVDPRNGGDIERTREFLRANEIRVFAEIATPSGGRHFYAAGDARLHKTALAELPGVDLQTNGCNVFIPGTIRPKYGAGYSVIDDALLNTLAEGDWQGVENMIALVGKASAPIDASAVTDAEAAELLTDGDPDPTVADARERAVLALSTATQHGRSRHTTALTEVGRLLRLGESCSGVAAAIDSLRSVFVGVVGDRANPTQARGEFDSIVRFMAKIVAADPRTTFEEVDSFGSVPDHVVAGQTAEQPLTSEPDRWHSLVDGASFILDQPEGIPALWGGGDQVLMADGEALIIAGPQGLGKTTLAGLLVAGMLGLRDTVLGAPIAQQGRILYLAMDRPRQAARALRRQLGGAGRELLADRLAVWQGPPIGDMAKRPELLAEYASRAGAAVVIVDSLKDAAIGLSDDEVGAGWNRARQSALAAGVNVIELHHNRKATSETPDVNDLYGSTWISSGAGSIILLAGKPGDPYVKLHHVKAPAEQVGPWTVLHDQDTGEMTIQNGVDLVTLAGQAPGGITAVDAAKAIYETTEPTKGEREKARRRLEKLVESGAMRAVGDGPPKPNRYVLTDPKSIHASIHAADSDEGVTDVPNHSREDVNLLVTESRDHSRYSRAIHSRGEGSLKTSPRMKPGSKQESDRDLCNTCGEALIYPDDRRDGYHTSNTKCRPSAKPKERIR
ncbi:AAA family ATPase [Gordonia sp. SND2]|uniref:AAA family ATPase n=1 Tax=Gordonia sp. SND2 TaxID=3388659 RepID=UPI00398A78BA